MKKPLLLLLLTITAAVVACNPRPCVEAPESHVDTIITHILQARDILRSEKKTQPVFVTFWDFDGTIILGDCTMGLGDKGHSVYSGLAEEAIKAGLSSSFSKDGYQNFLKRYSRMEKKDHLGAYTFISRIFSGAKHTDLLKLSEKHFRVMSSYYFISSMHIIRTLQREGIEVYVISASPDFFVRASSKTTGIPDSHIFGIKSVVKDGLVSSEILEPITYALGKVRKLLEILESLRKLHGERPVYVLAGFGNSYHTDGPFLRWIVEKKLPVSKPISVMINGGEIPAEYRGMFTIVSQEKTAGGK